MNTLPDPAELLAWWSRLWREIYARSIPFPSLAPQTLTQPILPGWLFANNISVTEQNSSSPETEREVVASYSYGRQLGYIIDVLAELIEKWPGGMPHDAAIERFTKLRENVETIKSRQINQAISVLADMKQRNRDEYDRLAPRLQEILQAGD
jgi:hypothetical protein